MIEDNPDADIIRFNNINFKEISETEKLIAPENIASVKYNKNEFIKNIFCNEIIDGNVSVTLWGKIYRRDLFIKSVTDYGKNILEDYYINIQYYLNTSCCIDLNHNLYCWHESESGTSHQYHDGTPEMIDLIHALKLSSMKNLGIDYNTELPRANDWLIRFCSNVLYLMQSTGKKKRYEEYKKIHSILKSNNVYNNLSTMSHNTDVKILKTKCFAIIDLYYYLRWHKHH